MNDIGRIMIFIGAAFVIIGLLIYFGGKILPLSRLPFDFKWESENFGVYFPLGTSIIISLLLTIILNLLFR